MEEKKHKIGLALAGGGARGIAHIGVLKALKEKNIEPQIIAGTSAGSIVGAMYADGLSTDEMMDFVVTSSLLKAYRPSLPKMGLTDMSYMRKHLTKYLKAKTFEELQKELYIAITNLNSGRLEIKNEGTLLDIVIASSSIPLIFKPVKIDDAIYVDGGLLNNMPASAIRTKCEYLIGVNVMPNISMKEKEVNGFTNITKRVVELSIWNTSKDELAWCDLVIEPRALHEYHAFNFNKAEEIFEIGYTEAMKNLEEVKL